MNLHDCYFPGCGGNTGILFGSATRVYVACQKCDASGPVCDTKKLAVETWNSLASRLKPQPKVVTIKRWVNVYEQDGVTFTGGSYDSKKHAFDDLRNSGYLDTVEVEITFTDSRV